MLRPESQTPEAPHVQARASPRARALWKFRVSASVLVLVSLLPWMLRDLSVCRSQGAQETEKGPNQI